MNTSFRKALLLSSILVLPVVLYASTDFSSLGTLVNNFTKNVVTAVGYLFLSMATVLFFAGIVQFIWKSREGDKSGIEQGKNFMLWGLIGLFVMFSVWGIIRFAQNTIGGDIGNTTITVPTLHFDGSGPSGSDPVGGSLKPDGASCSLPSECINHGCDASGHCTSGGS